ncbi:DUF2306 domain-containing protein [Lentzea californiensis]|uniref:DUF2306 domain-containing protein n=1 Tax=Lentzea californiensis TaxID=438851 RepID=UPI002165CA1E|nr:DUF2306 domain-containing protein [Lentzea californiensis]MCR3752218.1 putative membrane protein (DUF2306) [Lentzea californiensis]
MTDQLAPVADRAPAAKPRVTSRPVWRNPWWMALVALVVAFLVYALPPYFDLDPAKSLSPIVEGSSIHYPLLILHIVAGTLALLTACLQMSSWVRSRHPRLHRTSGIIYIFGGALPVAVTTPVLLMFSGEIAAGPGRVGRFVLGLLLLLSTIVAYRLARRHRYADHRRYMIYSFALIMDGVGTRLVLFLLGVVPVFGVQLPWTAQIDQGLLFEMVGWCVWVFNLLVAQWWIERTKHRKVLPANVKG